MRERTSFFGRDEWILLKRFKTQDNLCSYIRDALIHDDAKHWVARIKKYHIEEREKAAALLKKKYCGFEPKDSITNAWEY